VKNNTRIPVVIRSQERYVHEDRVNTGCRRSCWLSNERRCVKFWWFKIGSANARGCGGKANNAAVTRQKKKRSGFMTF